MKIFVLLFVLLFIATITFAGYSQVALAAQSEEVISQDRDLCNGTGGNGKIVSIGNKTFTIKRNNDGSNLIIHLSKQARIETSTGFISLSNLKKGDSVTLIGGPNKDGSFTADTVVVCSGTQKSGTSQATRITVRNESTKYKEVSGAVNLGTMFFVGLTWTGIVMFLRLKQKKSFVYLLFFTIFYIYLYKVLDYTLLQFQSLLLLKHFLPNIMLNGVQDGKAVNLIPLATLTLEDVKTSLLNILMMIPFGFGLPFITNLRFKKVVVVGLFSSIGIEFLQLITGFMADTTFRVADINDLIFNTIGVALGYVLFAGFVRKYRHVSRNWKLSNPILRYIAQRPQINNT